MGICLTDKVPANDESGKNLSMSTKQRTPLKLIYTGGITCVLGHIFCCCYNKQMLEINPFIFKKGKILF